MNRIYLDYNASSPLRPEALRALLLYLTEQCAAVGSSQIEKTKLRRKKSQEEMDEICQQDEWLGRGAGGDWTMGDRTIF